MDKVNDLQDEYDVVVLLTNKRTGVTSWVKYLGVRGLELNTDPVFEYPELTEYYGEAAQYFPYTTRKYIEVGINFTAQRYMVALDSEKMSLDDDRVKEWEESRWR